MIKYPVSICFTAIDLPAVLLSKLIFIIQTQRLSPGCDFVMKLKKKLHQGGMDCDLWCHKQAAMNQSYINTHFTAIAWRLSFPSPDLKNNKMKIIYNFSRFTVYV